MRRALALVAAVSIALAIGCSGGSGNSEDGVERVPVPRSKPPSSGIPPIDATAWKRTWRNTPGSAERRCVDTADHATVRSGEFVVGSFTAFRDRWDGTEETSKLAYIPLYPDKEAGLEVTATRRKPSPARVVTLRFGAINAWAMDGIPFYVTGTVLPDRGRWRLKARAGRNRGCFELQL
jgi:hypothetical protein